MLDDFANEKEKKKKKNFQRRENAKNKNRTLQTFKRYRLIRIAILMER